jgi:hypothetical protein
MIESIDPKVTEKPLAKCDKCDREVEHYNAFLDADDSVINVCWECMQRDEKGFFQKRDFHRRSRQGRLPAR